MSTAIGSILLQHTTTKLSDIGMSWNDFPIAVVALFILHVFSPLSSNKPNDYTPWHCNRQLPLYKRQYILYMYTLNWYIHTYIHTHNYLLRFIRMWPICLSYVLLCTPLFCISDKESIFSNTIRSCPVTYIYIWPYIYIYTNHTHIYMYICRLCGVRLVDYLLSVVHCSTICLKKWLTSCLFHCFLIAFICSNVSWWAAYVFTCKPVLYIIVKMCCCASCWPPCRQFFISPI